MNKLGKGYRVTVGVKGRPCAFPNCKGTGRSQGKQHADGSTYFRKWCRSHLKGAKKMERINYQSNLTS